MQHNLYIQNSCNTVYPRNMTCFRYLIVDSVHKADNNNNKNHYYYYCCYFFFIIVCSNIGTFRIALATLPHLGIVASFVN